MDLKSVDWAELRGMWRRHRAAVADLRKRVDPSGMTRPARDPDERAFLAERDGLGPFVEVDDPTYRIWRTGKYGTAAEVIAKWNRGELGPQHDPWKQADAHGSNEPHEPNREAESV
ncbi:MAG TPA: hypothetical protein VEX86_20780 [Longimicrobium sp.]|nr:hypothetical protein [Longimicrobium sp.]